MICINNYASRKILLLEGLCRLENEGIKPKKKAQKKGQAT